MQWKQLHQQNEQRTYAVILETGEEAMSVLRTFAADQSLGSSHFTAIGAFRDAVLAFFDWERKDYAHIPVREQVEVLALVGDVGIAEGKPSIHAHAVVGKRDGTAHGGHLVEAHVRPTLEVLLVESPGHLQRRFDPETGLRLIRLE